MPTLTTPTYIYRCLSDEVANGVRVCRATGWGEMFSTKRQGEYRCPNCGEALVLDGETTVEQKELGL